MATSALARLNKRVGTVGEKMPEVEIPLSKIRFNPDQPRKAFHQIDGMVKPKDSAYIEELAATIKANGLIHAITLEEMGDDTYRVVVGECRTRAHILLGLPTIRAVIRNDLTNPVKRLAYQLIENVTREELTEAEIADSIAVFMKGNDEIPPMKQVEIAALLHKSEGWVTRYVKFGDIELQRLWVETGIAETPENLYRISLLPQHAQVDIRRRVELPVDHTDYLAKPVERGVINEYAKQAKIDKMMGGQKPTMPLQASSGSTGGSAAQLETSSQIGTNGVALSDAVGQTLANLASQGQQGGTSATGTTAPTTEAAGTKYTLPQATRDAILNRRPTVNSGESGSTGQSASAAPVLPPVNCRATLGNIRALLEMLDGESDDVSIDDVLCTLNISGAVAQELANRLAGVVVDQKEVPAVLQSELSRLQLQ